MKQLAAVQASPEQVPVVLWYTASSRASSKPGSRDMAQWGRQTGRHHRVHSPLADAGLCKRIPALA